MNPCIDDVSAVMVQTRREELAEEGKKITKSWIGVVDDPDFTVPYETGDLMIEINSLNDRGPIVYENLGPVLI